MNKKNQIKILMAAAEAAPFAKVGGLGDVVGSLPPALTGLGCDVRLIMPLYGSIDRKKYGLKKKISRIAICVNKHDRAIDIYEGRLPQTRVPAYFIEEPEYFGAKEVYTKKNNAERFLFFSLACLYTLPHLKFRPDIIHCHDFHTALIPDLLRAHNFSYYRDAKTVFTIHNLNYQGASGLEVLSTGGLSSRALKSLSRDARDGDINFMVQGVLGADAVTTVSPTYAAEITTRAYGADLDNILRLRKDGLAGIVNGIDTELFDPAKDKFIKKNYSASVLSDKTVNKLDLQKKLGLPVDAKIPLAGMITRLVSQKGLELIDEKCARLGCQFVFLGTGKRQYEDGLRKLARKYPDKFSAQITFDLRLAQEIYAGSDIFLMPSRFEPCGLGQMIAMRYGTVPVARATGGIADTVDGRTGFLFKNFAAGALRSCLNKALGTYRRQPRLWAKMQTAGMRKDFSWNKPAREYLKIYRRLLR